MTDFQNGYAKLEKSELKRIEINELPKEIPNFKNTFSRTDIRNCSVVFTFKISNY